MNGGCSATKVLLGSLLSPSLCCNGLGNGLTRLGRRRSDLTFCDWLRNARTVARAQRGHVILSAAAKPLERAMTLEKATEALLLHALVEAGEGEDHHIGRIRSIDGDMALVAWQSGVTSPCPVADLSLADLR